MAPRVTVLHIPQDKLNAYLLDADHPDGGSKAKFFLARGFDLAEPRVLAAALLNHAMSNWPGTQKQNPYGVKHVVAGPMVMADASQANVRSVWQMRDGGTTAFFVTSYPI